MLENFSSDHVIGTVALITPVLFILIFFKNRRKKSTAVEGLLQGSLHELESEEKKLKSLPNDMREILLKTHVLCETFSTRHGFSRNYIADLEAELLKHDLNFEFHFQSAGPVGFADSLLVPQGTYELYVKRESLDQARNVIKSYSAKK